MSTGVLEAEPVIVPAAERITPEQLLEIPDWHRFELVDGQLVERAMGAESSSVAAAIIALLRNYVHERHLGRVFATDCGYQIFEDDPNRVRLPDGSFIAAGRLPGDKLPKGHVRIPPDLAVEVVSPNEIADNLETKRVEYLRAGIRAVWIVYPEARTVHVFRKGGPSSVLGDKDELTGEDVVPGFRCRVSELFEG